ncbi:YbaK/EbsC family protein [Paenibacillus thiaminolyticus]|uniref:YbaK/EbsC family protein n=1 Tax=Paenibacillus thiaminolyticus TaxID=49283 RepID=UPI0035A6C572
MPALLGNPLYSGSIRVQISSSPFAQRRKARGRIDLEAAAGILGRGKLMLASRDEVREDTGYEAGAIPLVGHTLPCLDADGTG